LGTAVAELFGTTGLSTSPSSVALVAATGVTSRRVAAAIGAIFAILAFLPPLSHALAEFPRPVIAATMLFTGCLVLTNGLQMIAACPLDNRKSLVVGLGIIAALAIEAHPHIAAHAPAFLSPIIGSSLVLGTSVGIALTLLFRIGAKQRHVLAVPPSGSPKRSQSSLLVGVTDFRPRVPSPMPCHKKTAHRGEKYQPVTVPPVEPGLERRFIEIGLEPQHDHRVACRLVEVRDRGLRRNPREAQLIASEMIGF
jgi:hypothetical protein